MNKEIAQEELDTAITLGDAACEELGICCEKRGQVIFRIYKKLRELQAKKDVPAESQEPKNQP